MRQGKENRMPALFEEMAVSTLVARNRIVRAATAESLAEASGRPTWRLIDAYRELADGGVGTIITGYTYVLPDGKPSENALGLYNDDYLDDYRELATAVHRAGAKIVLQLVYGGSKSKVASEDSRRIAPAIENNTDMPANAQSYPGEQAPNVSILGPSSVENPKTGLVPVQATRNDLDRIVRAFGKAAARAQSCGFDGVEIHVAHGYLLSQFLDRRFNVRADEYGGTLRNRARLALECICAVRESVGGCYPIFAKLNCSDVWEDSAGETGGLSEDESALVAEWLAGEGVDCIEVSGDWHTASLHAPDGEPYFTGYGARLARMLDTPIIVTGGWRDFTIAEAHLQSDGIAGIGMSRPLICEPDLPKRWLAGDLRPSPCTGCGHCAKAPGIPCALRNSAFR